MHLGVYGLLEKDNKILVVKKSRGPYKGLFDLPGGRPDFGESLEKTLCRELLEETGITVLQASLFNNFSFLLGDFYHIALVYKITKCSFANLDHEIIKEDVSGSRWIEREKLTENNSSPPLLATIKETLIS